MDSIMIDGVKFVQTLPLVRGQNCAIMPVARMRNDGDMALNKALREKVGNRIRLMCSEDGQQIAICASDEDQSFPVKKDGHVKAGNLRDVLARLGIPFPCRYEMSENGDMWVGKLLPEPTSKPKPDSAAKKPRKTGLKGMLPEGGRRA